jgi:hypothetical protein
LGTASKFQGVSRLPYVGPDHRRHRSRRTFRRRRIISASIGLVVVLVAISVIGAWRTPGNQDFKAKWADWLRSHHASVLVNHLESFYYSQQAPAAGGQPKTLNSVPGTQTDPSGGGTSHRAPPAQVPLVVQPALAGEGQWQPAGPVVGGRPGMYVAQFRADQVYTSQITSAVWIDTSLLKVALVPGASEPGGTWSETPSISGTARAAAVAAFNGGFRFQDAHGGFYLDGRQAVDLRAGAASLVIHANGAVDIGTWGREVAMAPDVRAVLQNLVPIVDQGQAAAAATYGDTKLWGATLGATTVVARSGVGVTATGALVYVAGPALTAKSLAESLVRAGAVRAMTLDINPEWVTFNFFQHDPAQPDLISAAKLYPQMQRPATRYLGPTRESRDFFTISMPGQ